MEAAHLPTTDLRKRNIQCGEPKPRLRAAEQGQQPWNASRDCCVVSNLVWLVPCASVSRLLQAPRSQQKPKPRERTSTRVGEGGSRLAPGEPARSGPSHSRRPPPGRAQNVYAVATVLVRTQEAIEVLAVCLWWLDNASSSRKDSTLTI